MGNQAFAISVLEDCLRAGVREFCICAGSRNSPLVLPLLRSPHLKIYHFFEERSAAFFALGRIMESGKPVAVVTTSGTAVAELLPATIEAFYQGQPLVLITADRPKRYRGSGAPQAIEQAEIFGEYVELAFDIEIGESLNIGNWDRSKPLHLNVCFDEPLHDANEENLEIADLPIQEVEKAFEPEEIPPYQNPLILLGAIDKQSRPQVCSLLEQLQAPIYAEATSGLREAMTLQHLMLASEADLKRQEPDGVIRIGGVPSCRYWRDLESKPELPVTSFCQQGFSGLARPSEIVQCDPASLQASGFRNAFVDRADPRELDSLLERFPRSEIAMVRWISQQIPKGARVFLGNSMPIREWNLAADRRDRGLQCFANRGANGIDGNLSTMFGIGANGETCWGIFGDLTTLYDASAPWILPQLGEREFKIVVIQNGGGKIFSRLPVLRDLNADEKAAFENHHSMRFEHWASMWELPYQCVKEPADILEGSGVIELRPDEEETESFWREFTK